MNSGHPERFTIASTFRALCLGHERADSVHAHRYRGMGDGGPELMWDLVAMTACADVPELQPLTHFGRERRQRCPASACGCSSTQAGLCPAVHKGRCALLVHRIRLLQRLATSALRSGRPSTCKVMPGLLAMLPKADLHGEVVRLGFPESCRYCFQLLCYPSDLWRSL